MEQIAEKIGAGLSGKSFEGSLKFDCGDDGVIVLADGTASTQDQTTDCTIKITQDNLVKLLTGKLNQIVLGDFDGASSKSQVTWVSR